MKKIIAIVCMISSMLLASVAVVPGENIRLTSDSNSILYVGGSGPGNYTRIQDAIDNASDGDTVFVYNGTYYERIVIKTSINLIGEDKYVTIIDGRGESIISVGAEMVNISGFSIRNSSQTLESDNGIYISYGSNHTTIYNNIFSENGFGVECLSKNNTFDKNYFISNGFGLALGGENNSVINNIFINDGVYLQPSSKIPNNFFNNNTVNGKPLIYLEDKSDTKINEAGQIILISCEEITIKNISLSNTNLGIELINTNNCTINDNNLRNCILGIVLSAYSERNSLFNNNIEGCGAGIYLQYRSDYNVIYNNKLCNISLSRFGININTTAIHLYIVDNNTFYGNDIINTKGIGISLSYYSDSHNCFYYNNFVNNTKNAYDPGNNIWYNPDTNKGNYWDDYEGIDANMDGIGDTPYNILGGNNQDLYPLVYNSTDMIPPSIKITKPEKGLYLFNNLIKKYSKFKPIIIGRIEIKANAIDNESGINHVEFYIDNELKYNDTEYPYSYEWKKDKILGSRQHTHTIKVVAYDNYGNSNYDEITVRKYL